MVYPPDARAPANEASARDAPFQVFETRFGCSSLRRGGRKFRLEKYFSEHSVLLRCVCMNTVCWFTTWSTEDMMTHSTTRLKVAARRGCTKPFMTVILLHARRKNRRYAEGTKRAAATCLPSCTSILYVAIAFGVSKTSSFVSVFRKNSSVAAGSASILFPHPMMRISGGGSTACAATSASGVISCTDFTPHSNDNS